MKVKTVPVVRSARLPLESSGGVLKLHDWGGDFIERKFHLPTPGIWYVWLKVTSNVRTASAVSFELDDGSGRAQVLLERNRWKMHPSRAAIHVQPHTKSQWVCYTLRAEHRAQIHIEKPGVYNLRLGLIEGGLTIEKVALTLFFSAKPKGDTLDHTGDPGGGRAVFPLSRHNVDGFREGWKSPELKSTRRFYIDAQSGNDTNAGTSPKRAWKSMRKANIQTFRPGDAILLKRGCRWMEQLAPRGNGREGNPILVGAYGAGLRPVIDGVSQDAFRLDGYSWWTVQDLELTSDPGYQKCGFFGVSGGGNERPRGLVLRNLVSHDNGRIGIFVGSWDKSSRGYDGVLIENCLAFCNNGDGINVGGSSQVGCRNSVIRFCTAFGNRVRAGIWIHSGENGLIERCRAYNNVCINIWAWNSRNMTIRHCEAFRGHESDAGGFDIDWGCEGMTVEYCYSHHNEGPGFLLMGSGDAQFRGYPMASDYNIMRYCVAECDGQPICVTETFRQGLVYNNVAVAGRKGVYALYINGWPFSKKRDSGGWASDTVFVNNIFLGLNGGIPALVDDYATTQNNRFDGNVYWNRQGGVIIRWGGRMNGPDFWKKNGKKKGSYPPKEYRDLVKFRKDTGQEKNGIQADPRLVAPGEGGYGRLPLPAYRLKSGSPALKTGRRVRITPDWIEGRAKHINGTGAMAYGIPVEPEEASNDYWGNPVEPLRGVSRGVHEK